MDNAEPPLESMVVPTTCAQRFTIRSVLSRGGMGLVCAAWDKTCGRWVAIKFLREEYSRHTESNDRLVREALVMGRLRHPGVPSIFDLGIDAEGRSWYAMRLIEGRELREEIDLCHAHGSAQIDRHWRQFRVLLRHFISVCRTIQWAHEAGFLHRDLKPANIFVSRHGESVVLDWGLAGRCESSANQDRQQSDSPPTDLTHAVSMLGDAHLAIPPVPLHPTKAESRSRNESTDAFDELFDTPSGAGREVVLPNDDRSTMESDLPTVAPSAVNSGNVYSLAAGHVGGADGGIDYSRVIDTCLTLHESQLGTPAYLAPEMRRGQKGTIDRRTDVYLLGATLFHLCSAQAPHGVQVRSIGELRTVLQTKKVASDLQAICLKAMSELQADRYASAENLAEDLERYLADEPISACVDSWPRITSRWMRRHWRVAASASAILLTLLVATVGVWIAFQQSQQLQLQNDLLESRRQTAASDLKRQQSEVQLANLYSDLNEWERLLRNRTSGWLSKAKSLQQTIQQRLQLYPSGLPRIRGLALRTALEHDVVVVTDQYNQKETWPTFHAGCIAVDNRSGLVALGQTKANLFVSLNVNIGTHTSDAWSSLAELSLLQGTKNLFQTRPQPGYRSACFSSDGEQLYIGSRDGDVFVWFKKDDFWKQTEEPLLVFKTRGTITALAVERDSKCLWIGTDDNWIHRLTMAPEDSATEDSAPEDSATVKFEPPDAPGTAVIRSARLLSRRLSVPVRSLSSIGECLYVSPSNGLPLNGETLEDCTQFASVEGEFLQPHPDNRGVFVSGPNRRLWIRDAITSDVIGLVAADAPLETPNHHELALSNDGQWLARTLASPTGAVLEVWDMTTNHLMCSRSLRNHLDTKIAFTPDSSHLWVTGADIDVLEFQHGDQRTSHSPCFSTPVRHFVGAGDEWFVATNHDTRRAASSANHTNTIEIPRMGKKPFVHSDSKKLLRQKSEVLQTSAASNASVSNPTSYTAICSEDRLSKVELFPVFGKTPGPLAASFEFREVISAFGLDDWCRVWTVARGETQRTYSIYLYDPATSKTTIVKPKREVDLDSVFGATTFASSGRFSVVGLRRGTLHVYDNESLEEVLEIHSGAVARTNTIAFAPSRDSTDFRQMAVGHDDGMLNIVYLYWNNDSAQHIVTSVAPHIVGKQTFNSAIPALLWLDEQRLLCSTSDGVLRLLQKDGSRWRLELEAMFDTPCIDMEIRDDLLVLHFEGHRSLHYLPLASLEDYLSLGSHPGGSLVTAN